MKAKAMKRTRRLIRKSKVVKRKIKRGKINPMATSPMAQPKRKIENIYFRRQCDQESEWLFSQKKGEKQIPHQRTIIFRRKGQFYG